MEKKEWCDRTERMVFNMERRGSGNEFRMDSGGVRNAIRKGVGSSMVKQVKSKAADK
jgi:hypothetical protein